ncbi:alcohol dehydrogenase [Botrytis cinerea]
MKATIYTGDRKVTVEDRPKPVILEPTDAIVKVLHTTICGTDLHILQGHVPSCTPGRIIGHEGVGVIESLGVAVRNFTVGQKVLISCITSCGTCHYCRRKMPSQCESGGWILGNCIDGTQAEYVRIPHAPFSLHALPESIDPKVAVTLSDTVPTSYECGVLNGDIQPGSTIAIIGTGPIGLMILQMARNLFGPSMTVMVGRGNPRLEMAKSMGADHTFSVLEGQDAVITSALAVTKGRGFDVVIEAVGLRTRLIDAISTPDLLKMVESGSIDPHFLVSHNFAFNNIHDAYEAFELSSKHGSLKVIITMPELFTNGSS